MRSLETDLELLRAAGLIGHPAGVVTRIAPTVRAQFEGYGVKL